MLKLLSPLLLVLSVVFQSYMQAMSDIYQRKMINRENALKYTVQTLRKIHRNDFSKKNLVHYYNAHKSISMRSVRDMLAFVRPHYSCQKVRKIIDTHENARFINLS